MRLLWVLLIAAVCLLAIPTATRQDASVGITLTAPTHHRHHCRHRHHRRCHRHHRLIRPLPAPPIPEPLWPWPQPAGSYPAPFDFGDPSGTYTFNCGADPAVGATINLCRNGTVAGVYLDDTTSNLPYWVTQATAKYPLVIVGQAPNGPCLATGTAICAQEWYPYDCRFEPGAWGPIRPARAYILQWFFAWPGCGPPTAAERSALLSDIQALHPLYIFTY